MQNNNSLRQLIVRPYKAKIAVFAIITARETEITRVGAIVVKQSELKECVWGTIGVEFKAH